MGIEYINKTVLPKLSDFDLGYIAAFLDGEGSITFSKKGQYRVRFGNSNQETIFWLREILGIGKIRIFKARKKQHLDAFTFDIERQGDVWGFLELISSCLKIKQIKAYKVLDEIKQKYQKTLMVLGG